MKTGILAQQSGKENPTNLLSNGDFECWTAGTAVAPDGWTLYTDGNGATGRDTVESKGKLGSYCARLSSVASTLTEIYFGGVATPKGITYWKNRKITFSCWVWCADAATARLDINTGAGGVLNSSYHTGSSTWELITLSTTIPNGADEVTPILVLVGNSTAYFDGAICVEGESAFAYADKPAGEGVWKDYFATSTIVGWQAGKTGTIYVKKIGKTVFVSYAILGTSDSATTTFTLPYTGATGNVYDLGMAWDNGGPYVVGKILLPAGDAVVTLNKDVTGAAFTNSGTKYVFGNFFYESA